MPTREEQRRRKRLTKDRSLSADELNRLASEFDREVTLKSEYYDLDKENNMYSTERDKVLNGQQPTNGRLSTTSKMLGDAGEYYALARFGLLGIPCAKMPDNWPEYDFVLDVDGVLLRVGVRTRSETRSFSKSSWFLVDADAKIDWSVFVISRNSGDILAWVVPQDKCLEHATPRNSSTRHISWRQLESADLVRYRDNWSLQK